MHESEMLKKLCMSACRFQCAMDQSGWNARFEGFMHAVCTWKCFGLNLTFLCALNQSGWNARFKCMHTYIEQWNETFWLNRMCSLCSTQFVQYTKVRLVWNVKMLCVERLAFFSAVVKIAWMHVFKGNFFSQLGMVCLCLLCFVLRGGKHRYITRLYEKDCIKVWLGLVFFIHTKGVWRLKLRKRCCGYSNKEIRF